MTVKSADDSTSTLSALWVHDLHLIAEEHDIIEHGDWLNDKVVDAVNNPIEHGDWLNDKVVDAVNNPVTVGFLLQHLFAVGGQLVASEFRYTFQCRWNAPSSHSVSCVT